MSKKPIKWKDLDFNKIKIGLDKKTTKLYYERLEQNETVLEELQIQFPHMIIPFGLKQNENKNQWSNFKEYYFDCSLKQNEEEENFNKFLSNLNSKIIELINNSSQFKEPCTAESYNSIEKTGKYNSLIKVNIQRDKEGNFNSYVFSYNTSKKHDKILVKDENINDVIKPKTIFIPIINCSKIYFYKDRYGSIWNLVQMLIIDVNKPKVVDDVYTKYAF